MMFPGLFKLAPPPSPHPPHPTHPHPPTPSTPSTRSTPSPRPPAMSVIRVRHSARLQRRHHGLRAGAALAGGASPPGGAHGVFGLASPFWLKVGQGSQGDSIFCWGGGFPILPRCFFLFFGGVPNYFTKMFFPQQLKALGSQPR